MDIRVRAIPREKPDEAIEAAVNVDTPLRHASPFSQAFLTAGQILKANKLEISPRRLAWRETAPPSADGSVVTGVVTLQAPPHGTIELGPCEFSRALLEGHGILEPVSEPAAPTPAGLNFAAELTADQVGRLIGQILVRIIGLEKTVTQLQASVATTDAALVSVQSLIVRASRQA